MNVNSGPLTKEFCSLLPEIDAALPASVENTNLIIRLGALAEQVERLELSVGKPPEGSHPDEQHPRDDTWHQERLNHLAEAAHLRGYIKTLEDELGVDPDISTL